MTTFGASNHAVILAGGGGTRLWPVSRKGKPKQFQALVGERSLLQRMYATLGHFYSLTPASVGIRRISPPSTSVTSTADAVELL